MDGLLPQIDPLDSRQFVIAVRKLADSLNYGSDRSAFLGSGVEYVQSRPYQPGDPIRAIDWRITAKTGKPHIKEYESPRQLPCYLLIDTSASMMISSVTRTKYELALQIAGGIGLACLDRVSPVGILGVGERDVHVRPSLARDQILQWLLQLRKFRIDETTSLTTRISQLCPTLLNRTLLIILSDLHEASALPVIRQLNQLHECVVLQLRDPSEDGLAGGGIVRAREAETGATFVTRISRPQVSLEDMTAFFRKSGVDHLVVRTDRPVASPLRHFFASRGILTRGAR